MGDLGVFADMLAQGLGVAAALSFPLSLPGTLWRGRRPESVVLPAPRPSQGLASPLFGCPPPQPLRRLPRRQPACCDLWEDLARGSQTGKFPVYTRIP